MIHAASEIKRGITVTSPVLIVCLIVQTNGGRNIASQKKVKVAGEQQILMNCGNVSALLHNLVRTKIILTITDQQNGCAIVYQ